MKKNLILTCLFVCVSFLLSAQSASILFENSSGRTLTVKVMKEGSYSDSKVAEIKIAPYGRYKQYILYTGDYYLKTKGELYGKKAVCKKGDPFEVYNGHDGYSEIKITYSITENESFNPLDGDVISEEEFDRDY